MPISDFPNFILGNYEIHEWRHATSIFKNEFPSEFDDVVQNLINFRLLKSHINVGGGGKSKVASTLDRFLYNRGWVEKFFNTKIVVDGVETETATHKVDCYKNRVALDVEWNNKTEFYDRDLNNYRLLHERNAISLGIIITRASELQVVFNGLGKGQSYGASTTHMDKLVPRLKGGSGGGCPILIIGIKSSLYDANG